MNRDIFKAYDIRGIFGVDFQPDDFYRIARVFAARFQPKTVAVGHDVRASSPILWQQVVEGLRDSGCDVLNLGQISTDMLYFAVAHYQTDGGITISASHNPADYNGMKLVLRNATPLSSANGLFDVRDELESGNLFRIESTHRRGTLLSPAFLDAYLAHLRTFVDWQSLRDKRLVINANGGLAGQVAERLLTHTPIKICCRLFTHPDGTFSKIPAGRPDPLRPENREVTTEAVTQTGADLAVAWDADADRCFFFDENGDFVEGCYITAMLAAYLLEKTGPGGVIFDPRAIWAVETAVKRAKGTPIQNRCGHSFIKARMRETDALLAGEASGHYYFRDNFYADNGMIPFLIVLEYLCHQGITLAETVEEFRTAFPVSGEINFSFQTRSLMREAINAVPRALHRERKYSHIEPPIDGISIRFAIPRGEVPSLCSGPAPWRFNLRESNTEPLLRLNVETRGSQNLLIEKTEQISNLLTNLGGQRDTLFRWEARQSEQKC